MKILCRTPQAATDLRSSESLIWSSNFNQSVFFATFSTSGLLSSVRAAKQDSTSFKTSAGVDSKANNPNRKLVIVESFEMATTMSSCASERDEIRLTTEVVMFQSNSCCGLGSFETAGSCESMV